MQRKKGVSIFVICLVTIVLIVGLFCALKVRTLYNKIYLKNIETLNLADKEITSVKELKKGLKKFPDLKTIEFGNNTISKEDKDELIRLYPNINFNVTSVVDINGTKIKDDVTYLDLSNINYDGDLVKLFNNFKNLQQVNLINRDMNFSEQVELKRLYPEITFEWNINFADTKFSSLVEELDFDKKEISSIDDVYSLISLMPNLKSIYFGKSNLDNELLAKLRSDFPEIKIVWKVFLGVWSVRTDAVSFSVLISNFKYKRMTSAEIEVLKYCNELQALDLGHQAITDVSVIADNLPNLRILILADNRITDISPLTKLKHLHYIELFINRIRDFSPLGELKELVDINLCYNHVSDVTPFLSLPKLERLWLNGSGVSAANLKKLKEQFPKAKISIKGPGSTGDGWRSHKRYFAMIDMFYKKNYMSDEFSKFDSE